VTTSSPATEGQVVPPEAVAGNLADLVRAAAERSPDKAALLFRDAVLSWSAVDAAVDRTATGLLSLGLAPGDRVALQLGNTP
jgi:non-ribosomal peptide synthetase component E (peptide arylation enzyme)